jgi:hypothetical protein
MGSSPAIHRSRVVFPHPEGPRRQQTCPFETQRESLCMV